MRTITLTTWNQQSKPYRDTEIGKEKVWRGKGWLKGLGLGLSVRSVETHRELSVYRGSSGEGKRWKGRNGCDKTGVVNATSVRANERMTRKEGEGQGTTQVHDWG